MRVMCSLCPGLTFLGILVGMVLGVSCDPITRRNCEKIVFTGQDETKKAKRPPDARLVRNNNDVSEPEFRLPPTIM